MCMLITVLSTNILAMLLIYFFDGLPTSTLTFTTTKLHQQPNNDGSYFLSVPCPRGWVSSFHGECFKVHANFLNWFAAKSECEAVGSSLAVLNSKAKLQDFSLPAATSSGGYWLWIGLYKDLTEKKRWLWVGGSRVFFTSWNTGEPNNARLNEDCGVFIMPSKKWNDHSCSYPLHYLCEINGKYNNLREHWQWFEKGIKLTAKTVNETSFKIRKKVIWRLRSPIFI